MPSRLRVARTTDSDAVWGGREASIQPPAPESAAITSGREHPSYRGRMPHAAPAPVDPSSVARDVPAGSPSPTAPERGEPRIVRSAVRRSSGAAGSRATAVIIAPPHKRGQALRPFGCPTVLNPQSWTGTFPQRIGQRPGERKCVSMTVLSSGAAGNRATARNQSWTGTSSLRAAPTVGSSSILLLNRGQALFLQRIGSDPAKGSVCP